MRFARLALTTAFALGGCRAFPEIPDLTCGNGVVEAGEDCDAYGRQAPGCRPAGQPGACHFDCTKTTGQVNTCPAGFGCDATSVCRRTTGGFTEAEITLPGSAYSLLAGDFDGNGAADVLSLEAPGALGLSRPSIHYFDATGALLGTWSTTKLVASPNVLDVSGDGRADLVSSTFQSLAILFGQPDRSLITAITPSFFLRDTRIRLIPVSDVPVAGTTQVVILTDVDGVYGLGVTGSDDPSLHVVATLPAGIDDLTGEPATANIDEDTDRAPCLDMVLGFRGQPDLRVYQPCEWHPTTGALWWRKKASVRTLTFEPASTVEGPPLLADLDGDGHVDLLVVSAIGPYAAFGDGHALGALTPYKFVEAHQETRTWTPAPIAAGDLTGDGLADFVNPATLLIAERQDDDSIAYFESQSARVPPWTEARIADFTGDGLLDAVAVGTSAADIEFFMGTGSHRVNQFVVPTRRSPRQLSVGDFDGDTLPDLAFVESAQAAGDTSEASETDEIAVCFAEPRAQLGAPIAVAHLEEVEQLVSASEHAQNTIADMLITHRFASPGGSGAAVSLIAGSGDRQLIAPILFNNYAANESLETFNTVVLTVGAFTHPDTAEVLALAIPDALEDPESPYTAWLMADLRTGGRGPQLLTWEFDPRFQPLRQKDGLERLVARLLSGDLDADALDELVVTSPLENETACLLELGKIDAEKSTLSFGQSLELDAGCEAEPQTVVQDVDGDGAADLVLLLGLGDARQLSVLWNDGAGNFDPERATSVLSDAASPRAFAFSRSSRSSALHLAVVMEHELRVLESRGGARAFRDLGLGRELRNGTGIVAADIDGDGVTDLAVADDGAVRVFRATLEGL